MENLKYYKDLNHNFFLAHEESTEFFVIYVPETNKWEDCNISFLNFKHDYDFKEITKEEVIRETNGNLPESMFKQYLKILNKNMGI